MDGSDHLATPHESVSDLLHDIDPRLLIAIACASVGLVERELAEVRYRNPRIQVQALGKRAGGYIVDLAFTIHGADGRVVEIWLFEIQLCLDPRKVRRWTLYLGAYENEFDADGRLVLVVPEPTLREQIRSKQLPRVRGETVMIEPDQIERITDYADARAPPQLAILGCLYHAHEPAPLEDRVAVVRAAWVAIHSLAIDKGIRYAVAVMSIVATNVVEQGIAQLREEGELDEQREELMYDSVRKGYAFQKGREEGREEGRCELLRTVLVDMLELRGLAVTAAQRERIEACESLEVLERWYASIKAAAANLDVERLLR